MNAATEPGYAGDLTPAQAWELLGANERALLVDVRTAAEWRFVGVPDVGRLGRAAAFVEWTTFPRGAANPAFLEQLAAAGLSAGGASAGGLAARESGPIVFLCRSGVRSVAAATAATAAGFGPAYNILGGFEGDLDAAGHRGASGWRAAGLPWTQS